jgi:hypothetical protein
MSKILEIGVVSASNAFGRHCFTSSNSFIFSASFLMPEAVR